MDIILKIHGQWFDMDNSKEKNGLTLDYLIQLKTGWSVCLNTHSGLVPVKDPIVLIALRNTLFKIFKGTCVCKDFI